MHNGSQAIDIMYYVSTPEFIDKWNEGKKGELICRMERALGGSLPKFDSIDVMVEEMDRAGVGKVFVTQTKMWSYVNQWMYMDTTLDEVSQYIDHSPDRFVGLAGYNPFSIKESLAEVDDAVRNRGFKGVYVHIYGFDIPINHARMYPLYAKCVELDVPVSLQVGHVLEAMPSEHGRPIYLDYVASDFPDLKLIGAHTGWPWVEEMLSVCYKWDNVYIGIDAWLPKYLKPELVQFMNSRLGNDRCLWGTNGLPWDKSLGQLREINLKPDVIERVSHQNARDLFGL